MRSLLFLLSVFVVGAHCAASILNSQSSKAIPNSFIVVLKPKISDEALTSHLSWADGVLKSKSAARNSHFAFQGFKGYHLKAPKAVAVLLAESDEVDYIEADQTFTIATTPESRINSARNVQTSAPWGLARISHRNLGSSDYVYQPNSGTYIYILDTGVRTTHQLFQGRASFGFNAVGGSNDDSNGHGTHIAGIASSQTYGVVRFANIISVKVLGDDGSSAVSTIISGVNWAVKDMQTQGRANKATALLAVGGSFSTAMNNAVASAASAGLFFAVPTGSDGTNGNTSPASEPTACTVGGTTIGDARMSSSNYGPGVDLWAPGASIPSLWYTSDTAVNTLSGSSMAAAHIAGLGAYFLALEGPRTPVALCARLREVATPNVLSGIPAGTANLLAYNLSGL
ncbi:subtilisin-like protein [Delitschia confertaspora ATCC 74209]|uniref:Subtilisin-like protein n=1 Tax=Delitschia confertaspora ATCC 74209 TaxID=1513339 RepID=A0A9P4JS50_9PLEO|nr:subtilisin-like protein [Delitschia confertaspora ATCC 74209]